jgi:hypothetical protein
VSARTDFFSAVLDGDEAKAREIFADGRLDANVRDGLIGRDAPALSLAARSGMVDLARDLLNHGANPNLYDGVQAPIHHAKSPQLVEMLAKAGANLNAPTLKQMDDVTLTREGSTALHMAVHANNPEMVAALLAHKANPLAVDAAYRTPEQYAIDRPDLLEPLQQARENLSRQQAPTVEQAAPAAPAIETPAVEQARAMDGADLEDRVNALLAGVDPLTIDGGEQVAEYLAMSGEALSREPDQLNAGDAQKQAAPEVNTIGPAEGEREPGRPAAAPDTAPGVDKTPDAGKDEVSVSKDDEDEQRAKRAPILDKSGYEIPQSVKALYVAVEGKFVDRKTEQIAFEDIGRKLSTKSEDRKVVEHMIEVAQAKNWGKLDLKGTEAFRRQAWIAAQVAGLETSGYKPTEQDRAAVEARRTEMRISTGSKEVDRAPENAISTDDKELDPSKPRGTERTLTDKQSLAVDSLKAMLLQRGLAADQVAKAVDVATSHFIEDRVHVGRVVEHGSAPYEHNADNSASYYVKLATDQGEQTIWGVDLARSAEDGVLKTGEDVALAYQGRTEVVVPTKELDENGKPTGRMTETVAHRNTWEVLQVDKLRDLATDKDIAANNGPVAPEKGASAPVAAAAAPQMTPEQLKAIRDEIAADRKTLEARERGQLVEQYKDPKFREAKARDLLRAAGRDPQEFFDDNGPKPVDQQGRASKEPGRGQAVLSTREAVLSQILETEMNNKGLPPEERQTLRDNLNAAFAGARAQGVELDIPEPMVVDRGDAPDPGKSVEVAQAQPAQTQEVER